MKELIVYIYNQKAISMTTNSLPAEKFIAEVRGFRDKLSDHSFISSDLLTIHVLEIAFLIIEISDKYTSVYYKAFHLQLALVIILVFFI